MVDNPFLRHRHQKAMLKRLSCAPLMEGIENEVIEKIAQNGRPRTLKGRHGRVCQEELSARLFFVLTGEMRMFRLAPDGQELLVQRFGAGEFFCLAAAVSGHPCRSFLVNFGLTELLVWNREVFSQQMQECPRLYHNVLHQMAFQVEKERDMRTLCRCCRADIKVAAYLLHRMKTHPNPSRQTDLIDLRSISLAAQELGMARETLSRCLRRLVRRRGIMYRRGMVQVTDVTCLESVLEALDCSCGDEQHMAHDPASQSELASTNQPHCE